MNVLLTRDSGFLDLEASVAVLFSKPTSRAAGTTAPARVQKIPPRRLELVDIDHAPMTTAGKPFRFAGDSLIRGRPAIFDNVGVKRPIHHLCVQFGVETGDGPGLDQTAEASGGRRQAECHPVRWLGDRQSANRRLVRATCMGRGAIGHGRVLGRRPAGGQPGSDP